MSKSVVQQENMPLSEDVAVCIALAARELPDVEVKDLLLGLINLLGEPITQAKLTKVRLNRFKKIPGLEEIEVTYLRDALNVLKGKGINCEPEPLPQVQPPLEDEASGSIRVACASNGGDRIDGHFGSCTRYLIYQVSAETIRLVDIRTPGRAPEGEDKNVFRAHGLSDCQVLYTISIGGPAAAKVVRAGLHPIKIANGAAAPVVLERLQEAIQANPPPWLAKAMGIDAEDRVRFKEEAYG
ncbi:MAG: dinitrogenase iron-molybdenum cofactor biosynthesis protein [Pseudomonadales bacterium]|nr:dinitrogenase iron-molybdenum cofactor biosynthesis protein [Pseudomonadales bacterium]